MPERTSEKLARALREAGAPQAMIDAALAFKYDDYLGDAAMNINLLVADANEAGLPDIAERAMNGEWDAQKWESDEWAASPEGRETFDELVGRKR